MNNMDTTTNSSPNSSPFPDPLLPANFTYHHIHVSGNDKPRLAAKIEKNTKGYNWEVSVSNSTSPEELATCLRNAQEKVEELIRGQNND